MRNSEVIDTFEYVLMNKNMLDYRLDKENNTFYDESGEIEYQIRDYTNGDFHCILMRFAEDTTHTYMELYLEEFDDDIYSLIYYALEDGVEELERRTLRAMERRV